MKKNYILLLLLISLQTFAQCWQDVSAGDNHSLGIKTDGTLWAWGENFQGQLGDGTRINKNIPTQIGTSNDWLKVYAGFWYSIGIKSNGTLWTWGYNVYGQLGYSTTIGYRTTPTQVGTATNWTSAAAGYNHTLALKTDGTLWSWGSNVYGELGINSTDSQRNFPTQIGTESNWTRISAGEHFSFAVKSNLSIWGWGLNSVYQLGFTSSAEYFSYPRDIASITGTGYGALDVSTGYEHAINLNNSQGLSVWGSDNYGQLGTVNTGFDSGFAFSEGVQSIEAGPYNTFIILGNGRIVASGRNDYGQLGNGTTNQLYLYTNIGTASDYERISAGGYHTLTLRTDGTLKACGRNDYGQLGDGTTTQRNQFVSITCPTTLAIEDITITNDVKVYPNPVENSLNFSFNKEIKTVSIYNLLGQEVLSKSLQANEGSVDISSLQSGTYFVKVFTDNQIKTLKVIKE